jgi:uncharacterized protein
VTLMLWIVRAIILFIIIRFVVLMVRGALAGYGSNQAPGPGPRTRVRKQPERIGGTLVQDPECGTYLPVDRAITVHTGGGTHHFCSVACRDKWQGKA